MESGKTWLDIHSIGPCMFGLILGVALIFGLPYLNVIESGFIRNTIVAFAIFLLLMGAALLFAKRVKLSHAEIELWEELRRSGRANFLLHETFARPVIILVCLALGLLQAGRDSINGYSHFENLSFYVLPSAVVIAVQFLSSIQTWSEFEGAYLKRRK